MKRTISLLLFLFILSMLSWGQLGYIHHWEMMIDGESTWKYFCGTTNPPSNWKLNSFDDTGWNSAQGGVGYGNNDDKTTISACPTLYLRKKITITDIDDIEQLLINAHYDDGFIAYLNGKEIYRQWMGADFSTKSYNDTANIHHISKLSQGKSIEHFLIKKNRLSTSLLAGENTLAIEVHNSNNDASGLTALFYLFGGMNTSEYHFSSTPDWFQSPPLFSSNSTLPIIRINTLNNPIGNDIKSTAKMEVIYNRDGSPNQYSASPNQYDGYIGIEHRGQSSLQFEKHSYGIETRDQNGNNIDTSLLGLPAENDWVLYGAYSDKSLIRNYLTYKYWLKIGRYAPRCVFCELFLDNEYMGLYMLTEKIKINENRVDIATLLPEDTLGNEITGGYIIKVDKDAVLGSNAWEATNPPYTYFIPVKFQFHEPKAELLHPKQKGYIQNYIDSLQNSLLTSTNNLNETFTKYIDKGSAIDKLIMTEFSKDIDSYKYSQYMFKDKNSKNRRLKIGPAWDYDLGYGNVDFGNISARLPEGWIFQFEDERIFWFDRMMQDDQFRCDLSKRWATLRKGVLHTDSIFSFIDSTVDYIYTAQEKNHYYWNTLGNYVWPNNFVGDTYEQEINYLKDWISARVNWMDSELTCNITTDTLSTDSITYYPNPFKNKISFYGWTETNAPYTLEVVSITGKLIFRAIFNVKENESFQIDWDGTNNDRKKVDNGIYFYTIYSPFNRIQSGKIIKQQ